MANKITCRPDYHINRVSDFREYNQTLKLYVSQESKHYLIVCSSNWTDYHDTIRYRESNYYCMIANGSFINVPKP